MKTFPFNSIPLIRIKMCLSLRCLRYTFLRPRMLSPTNTVLMAIAACDLLMVICPAPWFVYAYTFNK